MLFRGEAAPRVWRRPRAAAVEEGDVEAPVVAEAAVAAAVAAGGGVGGAAAAAGVARVPSGAGDAEAGAPADVGRPLASFFASFEDEAASGSACASVFGGAVAWGGGRSGNRGAVGNDDRRSVIWDRPGTPGTGTGVGIFLSGADTGICGGSTWTEAPEAGSRAAER